MDRPSLNKSTERICQIVLEALSTADIDTFQECLSELSPYRTRGGGEWYAQALVEKENDLRCRSPLQVSRTGYDGRGVADNSRRDPSCWWGAGWKIGRLAEILGVDEAALEWFACTRPGGSGINSKGYIPDLKSVEWIIMHAKDFGCHSRDLRSRWARYEEAVLQNPRNRRGNANCVESASSSQGASSSKSSGANLAAEPRQPYTNPRADPQLPGDYESGEFLGERGPGAKRRRLWKAKKRGLERSVMVKVFSDLSQIDREAHCLERAGNCTGVPQWRETHKIRNDGSAWVEMDWIDGEKLDSWTEQNVRPGAESQYSIARELIRTVMCLHARAKVAHCDIKPSNIIVESGTGRVHLVDFGSAVPFEQAQNPEWGRNPEHRSRTLRYAPPEALKADYAESTTETTLMQGDVFSLAATIWEMLCGIPPLGAEAYSADSETKLLELYCQASLYPVGAHEFPTQAWKIMLEKSLERDRAKRLNSISQMLNYIDPPTATL